MDLYIDLVHPIRTVVASVRSAPPAAPSATGSTRALETLAPPSERDLTTDGALLRDEDDETSSSVGILPTPKICYIL